MDIHATIPNPYTLLSTLPPNQQWYTALDLKGAFFFSLPLPTKSQTFFAFEWHDHWDWDDWDQQTANPNPVASRI